MQVKSRDFLPPPQAGSPRSSVRRSANLIDRWDGQTYRRVLVLGDGAVEAAVTQHGPPDSCRLRVRLSGARFPVAENAAKAVLERVLGSRLDLSPFYRLAGADAKLGPLAERFRGLKPPRFAIWYTLICFWIAWRKRVS